MAIYTFESIFDFFMKACFTGLFIIGTSCLLGLGVKSMLRIFRL